MRYCARHASECESGVWERLCIGPYTVRSVVPEVVTDTSLGVEYSVCTRGADVGGLLHVCCSICKCKEKPFDESSK